MSASLRSRRVGSPVGPTCRSVTMTRPARVLEDHLAVADLVLHPAEGMDAEGVAADAPFRLLGHLGLGDQVAGRRIPARESRCRPPCGPGCVRRRSRRDIAPAASCPSDSSTSTPVSSCAKPVTSRAAIDRHRQLLDPAGQDALDVVLPQPEPVGVAGGKVADVELDPARTLRPAPSAPRRGTDRRFRAGRRPRCVRACRPPAREPARSWLGRRSTMATSTPANANSPANISPVGPAPAIKTSASRMVVRFVRRSRGRLGARRTEEMCTRTPPLAPHKAEPAWVLQFLNFTGSAPFEY